ncbi:MAG: hypothetical protein IPN34_22410 [Planctomycetes bacterium]|nr:hypothetical protein [Planctomycetota bacterium]
MKLSDLHLPMAFAGAAQLLLCLGTLALPRVLGWREKLALLPTLERQMFYVYAAYIWGTNLAFGLVSLAAPGWMLDGSGLASAVLGFIALYWGARVALQFLYFDLRSARPPGVHFVVAERALDLLFVGLTLLYGAACACSIAGLR